MDTITLKETKRHVEHVVYTVTLEVEECQNGSDGHYYPQFYVTLNRGDRSIDEIAHYEPCDLGLALDYYNELEDYIIEKASLYDELESRLITISRNAK